MAPAPFYKPQLHDSEHTMERQILLLASAATRVWSCWAHFEDQQSKLQGISEQFDEAMRELYRQVYQTDVFMGGVAHNRSALRAKAGNSQ